MINRPKRILLLMLCLLLCLLPLCAQAEEALPSADHLNMATVTVSGVRYDDGTGETALPLTIDLSLGADLANRRGMALVSLNTGEAPLTFMGSIENEEVRARISGVEPLLTASLPKVEDQLIQSILLLGLEYEDCSVETLAALDEYLALLEESMLMPVKVVESSDMVEAMYPADQWREDYEKYPSLMNAVPAGEEEITLFGKAYTAKKYTYSIENATEEEFLAFYEAYDAHFYGATGELEKAYEKLILLVYEDLEASMQTDDIWKDDGSAAENESGSLSEWDEAENQGYLYSIEGTIWQVDEVMGMLEEYTAVTRGPEGEYVDTYSYSDMLIDGLMRYESTSTESDAYCIASTTDSMTVQADETGRILMEGATITGARYPEDGFSGGSQLNWRSEMTKDRLLLTMNEALTGSSQSEQLVSVTADFALGQEEATGLTNRASGPLEFKMNMLGEQFSAAMDMNILLGTLPEGTLLPVSGETFDLFEADEAVLSALLEDLSSLLIQAFGSFVPAPEAPSSVGGALLG